jgi:hypothetical protein
MKNYFLLLARVLTGVKTGCGAFVFVWLTAAAANAFAQQPGSQAAPASDIEVKAY